uniref:TFIIS-type domain-containing protein n=1 Tax=Fervidicoccus fontis TaxID=683846 RepID=A0A7J3ZKB2_9CREN
MKCPKCGTVMYYRMESEKLDGNARKITSYYKCTICGYRVNDQVIILHGSNGALKLTIIKQASKTPNTKKVF